MHGQTENNENKQNHSTLTKADIHWSLCFYLIIYALFVFVFRNIFQLYDKGESVCLNRNVLEHKVVALECCCFFLIVL